jgi:uncharacterized 2Fe-2S/4Fe-4S cluster protein (DUF4445 family)
MNNDVSVRVETEDGISCKFVVVPREQGRSLADLLAEHGFPLNTRCGRRGLCHGCEVQLREGCAVVGTDEVTVLTTIRACQARVVAGSRQVLQIPAHSRIEQHPQAGDSFHIDVPYVHQPLFRKTAGRDIAFAADVGTTTVAVLLVDLSTGAVLSRAGAFNDQIRFGDNVLTRIDAARDPTVLSAMQAAATATLATLLQRAAERAGRPLSRLAGGTVSGNTTMLHLLVGTDPSPLGVAPFTPCFLEGRRVTAGELGLTVIGHDLPVQLLPGIAAYIGADITAGVYATGMSFDGQPSLLVDIGTNGEIVLQSGGQLTACATAAGPAFEGSGLRCGVRAHNGAICDIGLELSPFRLGVETIGGAPPARAPGICGSAYIGFLATARRCGLLNEAGRFTPGQWQQIPPTHRLEVDDGKALRVAGDNCISEADIAILLSAKAAIGAGIETLLAATGIGAGNIARVYLAGGFGMHLDTGHAIAIGLLPGFRKEQVRVAGNTALAGALLALADSTTLEEMETLRGRIAVLELNLQEGFGDRFVDHLSLP